MTQAIVRKRFSAFSRFKYEDHLSELEKRRRSRRLNPRHEETVKIRKAALTKDHDHLIKILKEGHCFGFALNYGIQHRFGKRLWWKNYLQKITTWDKKRDSLAQKIIIPGGSRQSARDKNRNTFSGVIDYGMNAIIPLQGEEYLPESIFQENILSPSTLPTEKKDQVKSYIEYLHNGIIYTIKQHAKVAGTLSREKLIEILSEEDVKKSMIFVHGAFHTVYLGWMAGSTWVLYDPNYDHTDVSEMDMTGTLEECLDEMNNIFEGSSYCLEFASFKLQHPFKLTVFNEIMDNDFASLLVGDGFLQVCEHLPAKLLSFLDEADLMTESRDNAVKRFTDVINIVWTGCVGLQELMFVDKRILKKLLEMGKQSIHYKSMQENIFKAIAEKGEKGNSVLSTLIVMMPSNILPMLEFLITDTASLIKMLDLLNVENKKNIRTWQKIDNNAAIYKDIILNFLIKKMTGINYPYYANIKKVTCKISFPELVLEALLLKLPVKGIDHGFEVIVEKTPDMLPAIVRLALVTPKEFDLWMQAFYTRRDFSKQNNWERIPSGVQRALKQLLSAHIMMMDEKTVREQLKKFPLNMQNTTSEWVLDRRKAQASLVAFLQNTFDESLKRFTPASVLPQSRRPA